MECLCLQYSPRGSLEWNYYHVYRDHSGYGLSQRETMLHCNVTSSLNDWAHQENDPWVWHACCEFEVFPTFYSGYSTWTIVTQSNANIFRVTGPLWGESTDHRWICLAKASDAKLWCFLWSASKQTVEQTIRDADDLKRHRAHYDVTVIPWLCTMLHTIL